ncbi:MAG: hypothetical protein QG622_3328 [Actinomycetota bacterium]|nr:hypothetical protein [Actinomycetota bacterium]
MSLRTLSGLSGLSAGFLSMIENGQRHLERTSHVNALAQALRIAPAELLGQPFPPVDPTTGTAHEAVPAIRLALMAPLPTVAGPPAATTPLPVLTLRVRQANRLYHACDYTTLAHTLPGLLADLHAALEAAAPDQRPELLRLTVQAYHPACTLLLKTLGYTDLAFLSTIRAADLTTELDDPLDRALSGFFHTHVLMAAGNPDLAYSHAEGAADLVLESLRRPSSDRNRTVGGEREPLALLGELHLIRASALAQDLHRAGGHRADQVREHLEQAWALAARTGETRAWHLNFGPTNVMIHQVSLHTDLAAYDRALRAGQSLRTTITAPPGRIATFHSDLGRAMAHRRGHHAEAVGELLTAERAAPQRVRTNPAVRQAVATLLAQPLPVHVCRDLRGLAHRVGL